MEMIDCEIPRWLERGTKHFLQECDLTILKCVYYTEGGLWDPTLAGEREKWNIYYKGVKTFLFQVRFKTVKLTTIHNGLKQIISASDGLRLLYESRGTVLIPFVVHAQDSKSRSNT